MKSFWYIPLFERARPVQSRRISGEYARCLAAHIGLVVLYTVMRVLDRQEWWLNPNWDFNAVQTAATTTASTVGTIYTTLLLMLTQRLALRRNLLERQTLTTLHDRTSAWLGLGAGVKTALRQRSFSPRVLLTVLYMGLLFGIHNTTPALPITKQGRGGHYTSMPVGITQMTPPAGHITTINPAQYLSVLNILPTSLNGLGSLSSPYSISDTPTSPYLVINMADSDSEGTYAVLTPLCTTTFSPNCSIVTTSALAPSPDVSNASTWVVTIDNNQTVSFDPSAFPHISTTSAADPAVRIVGSPSEFEPGPDVILLALSNVTDASSIVHNGVHVKNSSLGDGKTDLDLTFLRCSLQWNVCTSEEGPCAVNACSRIDSDLMGSAKSDPVHYDWTSNWAKWIRHNTTGSTAGAGVVSGTANSVESYMTTVLGDLMREAFNTSDVAGKIPTVEQLEQALANITTTIFWLDAWVFNNNQGSELSYIVTGQQPTSQAAIIGISSTAASTGLALSVLATIVVIVFFWGRPPTLRAITDAGVLELAWLFARQPKQFRPLLDVEIPTRTALRKAGKRVAWKGVSNNAQAMELSKRKSPSTSASTDTLNEM